MTFSRVVEKLHKWHRNSFAFGVDVDALAGDRFIANEDEVYDLGVDNVGVACADFNDKFWNRNEKMLKVSTTNFVFIK